MFWPICLLDDAGKLFERVLAARLSGSQSWGGPGLIDCRYCFREGTSRPDAIDHVRHLADKAISRGGVTLAISVDIANAFNTLRWHTIWEALQDNGASPYLRTVLRVYLSDRWIEHPGRDGVERRQRVIRGVHQGSVVGPLLWNVGYDSVLHGLLSSRVCVVCCADDTLVILVGRDRVRAVRLMEVAVALVASRIRALGLTI